MYAHRIQGGYIHLEAKFTEAACQFPYSVCVLNKIKPQFSRKPRCTYKIQEEKPKLLFYSGRNWFKG